MNIEQKAAVIEEVAEQIRASDAIFAVDYRGLSVKDAAELRGRLIEAGAVFRVVKNRLTIRAADQAGAESLKELLEGPTAFTFVSAEGDVALAAKALAQFRRQTDTLAFKGGQMNGEAVSADQIESISRLPARDVLQGQFVGVLASPLTGLVRGLASLISGFASQLKQIEEQGLVTGAAPEPVAEEPAAAEPEAPAEEGEAPEAQEPAAAEAPAEEPEAEAQAEAPAANAEPEQEAEVVEEPAAEAEPEAAEEKSSETPSEGE